MHQVVPTHTYLFWVRCHPNRTFFPKKLNWEPQNRPFFLPTTKSYPLKALTHAHLPCIGWVQVGGAMVLCASFTPFEFVSFWPSHHFCCFNVCLILLYMLVDVYLLWHEGCVEFWAYIFCLLPFFGLVITWAKAFISLLSLCFSFSMTMSLLAIDPAMSLHRACYSFTSLFISCYPMGLCTDASSCQSTSSSVFCSRLPWLTFHIFTSFGLCWPTFLLCQPISLPHSLGFLGPFTFFTPMGFLAKFFGLLQPNFYIFTSYHFSSLLAFKPTY